MIFSVCESLSQKVLLQMIWPVAICMHHGWLAMCIRQQKLSANWRRYHRAATSPNLLWFLCRQPVSWWLQSNALIDSCRRKCFFCNGAEHSRTKSTTSHLPASKVTTTGGNERGMDSSCASCFAVHVKRRRRWSRFLVGRGVVFLTCRLQLARAQAHYRNHAKDVKKIHQCCFGFQFPLADGIWSVLSEGLPKEGGPQFS